MKDTLEVNEEKADDNDDTEALAVTDSGELIVNTEQGGGEEN